MLELYKVAAKGLIAEMAHHEVVANNLANARTGGFMRDTLVVSATAAAVDGGRLPEPEVAGIVPQLKPGGVRATGNPLDLVVSGEGYFVLRGPDGLCLTRNGAFSLDGQGNLVSASGYPVEGEGGPIQTEARTIQVSAAGELFGDGNRLGRLSLMSVAPGKTLVKNPEGYLVPLGGDGDLVKAEQCQVMQGYLEDSAVEPVREMVDMIAAFRAYEAGVRSLQSLDDALGIATGRIGRLV